MKWHELTKKQREALTDTAKGIIYYVGHEDVNRELEELGLYHRVFQHVSLTQDGKNILPPRMRNNPKLFPYA